MRKSNTNTQRIEADSNPITQGSLLRNQHVSRTDTLGHYRGCLLYTHSSNKYIQIKSGRDLFKELCTSLIPHGITTTVQDQRVC